MKKPKAFGVGRFAYEGLDRLFHERARLAILTTLASRPEGVVFADLKELCALTDGNQSRHLQCLRAAGVIEIWKRTESGRPQTLCRLSSDGRKRFLEYLDVLEAVVGDAAEAARASAAKHRRAGGGADPSHQGLAPA